MTRKKDDGAEEFFFNIPAKQIQYLFFTIGKQLYLTMAGEYEFQEVLADVKSVPGYTVEEFVYKLNTAGYTTVIVHTMEVDF